METAKNYIRNQYSTLRKRVFLPPYLLLLAALVLSLAFETKFLRWTSNLNAVILDHFDWLYNWTSFVMVLLCLVVFVSPLGKKTIGGPGAQPLLSKWRWFSIVLCTTIAVGILFWGVAEPLYHLSGPPSGLGVEPMSPEAGRFAMSTMFMHWSFTPYAIYAIPALLFALGYYNKGRSFSLASMLFPFGAGTRSSALAHVVNAISLFALAAGMAAVLGAGILTLSGGLVSLIGGEVNAWILGLVTLTIVASFTISAASGLLKGIRTLSAFNLVVFLLLAGFVLITGPTSDMIEFGTQGVKDYLTHFIPQSLALEPHGDQQWMHSWTTFYWANWMAWTPVTALFLGRIAYGYTVRLFLLFNWILPALFSMVWMTIFSGAALSLESSTPIHLVDALQENGPESIIYHVLEALPMATWVIPCFLLAVFVSYVTAADSNTDAMSGLSSKGVTPDNPNPPNGVKYLWGILIGMVAWIMIANSGVDGIRMLSNLGGLPALLLLVGTVMAMVWLLIRHRSL